MLIRTAFVGALFVFACQASAQEAAYGDDLRTVAEKSEYRATSRYDDVVTFIDALEDESDLIWTDSIGRTVEGRDLPLLVVANPRIESAEAARRSDKLTVLLIGNIHAGEVCGKEALMMLARELALDADHPLLKDLIVLIVPIYNADGNERMDPDNRPGQVGPEEGMGERPNAQGLDLNRDYVKIDAPETRALLRLATGWDPAVTIDTHTTNGSHHRYDLTYAGPKNPAGDSEVIGYVRDVMLPAITDGAKAEGIETFFYGNFQSDHTRWTTYPDQPRYGTPYRGLRNRISVLSEAYAYATFKERVESTLIFCRETLEYAAQQKKNIRTLLRDADRRTVEAGKDPGEDDRIVVRSKVVPFEEQVTVPGFVEEERDGRRVATDETKDYEVDFVNDFTPALTVSRPFAYLIPDAFENVVDNLQVHGVDVELLREDIELDVESYRLDSVEKSSREFQGHRQVRLEATAIPASRRIEAGTYVVRTGQELGTLACYLLEPQASDGLAAWNFFDDAELEQGNDFPVKRLPAYAPLLLTKAAPLPEDRVEAKPVTFEALYEGRNRPNFSGSAVGSVRWHDDGEHYFQRKDGKTWKVHALTGRTSPIEDTTPLSEALATLPTVDEKTAVRLAGRRRSTDEARTGALFDHENDLYYCRLDGSMAVRLTSSPQREEVATFSPDGHLVAFVRENDLWIVDVPTQTERQLTITGADHLRNGKNDWVYYEEVFGRNWKAFWWSPDSKNIAFLETDSEGMPTFTIVDDGPKPQRIETATYPKPGQQNPRVRLGLISAGGGSPRWADLEEYDTGAFLITGVGFWPDGMHAYAYVQDRIQTWLDVVSVTASDGSTTRLFRDTTEAWVDQPAAPRFLEDGSFLMTSERSGWKHLYHFEADGTLRCQVTDGEWEVSRVHRFDEEAGILLVEGTRDSHIARNLYRVNLDGSGIQRLTDEPGSHRVSISPNGKYIVDNFSSHAVTPKTAMRNAEGNVVRWIDVNPVHDLEAYSLGRFELVQIEMDDGFVLEGSLLYPPDFDETRQYPVWFMTYGGPHAPTIRDSWSGRTWDHLLSQTGDGIIVFRADPRSASGKGAISAWACYRQLGISELEDIEAAISWLCERPYIDADRIGMAGHSYGGFMTAFALTHSTTFCAGIAGAPVADWHDYDTIYTERFMSTPQDNPDGYKETSVVEAAGDLHGRLLLAHGTMDDNVHMQNSTRLVRALQRADKAFEFMMYPGSRHGIGGTHYRRLQHDFITRTLDPVFKNQAETEAVDSLADEIDSDAASGEPRSP